MLAYTWVLAPITPRWTAVVAGAVVLAIAVVRSVRTRECGLTPSAFLASLAWSAAFTATAVAVLSAVARRGPRGRFDPSPSDAAVLLLWGLGQQFVLQTVLLRDAQAITTRNAGIVVAAALFAILHLPNPFLTAATLVAALAWSTTYQRHPNVLPLALSHAVLTVVVLYLLDDAVTGRLRVGAAY